MSRAERLEWLTAWCLLGFTLAAPFLALIYPLELDLREGTSWLFALTQKAGISIYDETRVAYLNVNHGPLDALLKGLIFAILPFLDAPQLVRIFVYLLPLACLGLAGFYLKPGPRDRVPRILIWGCLAYLGIRSLWFFHLLVGRGDDLAHLMMIAAAATGLRKDRPPGKARAFAVGLCLAAVVLANTRFFPTAFLLGAACLLLAGNQPASAREPRWQAALSMAGGGIALILAIFAAQFHLDAGFCYRHFIGFFTKGYGHALDPSVFSPGLFWAILGRTWPHLLMGVLFVSALLFYAPRRQARVWAVALILGYLSCLAALLANLGGGGPYYFSPFTALLGFGVLCHLNDFPVVRRPKFHTAVGVACLLLFAGPLYVEPRAMLSTLGEAYWFRDRVREMDSKAPLAGDSNYFYKRAYTGEIVDSGDVAWTALKSGFFGTRYDRMARAYFEGLKAHPPSAVYLNGETDSPPMKALVQSGYRPVLVSPVHFFFNAGKRSVVMVRVE